MSSARELIGPEEDFLFLAGDEVVLDVALGDAWRLLEGDAQERLLRALSPRFVGREVVEVLPDGYRCTTAAKVRFGTRRSFASVVWLDEPARSVEVQHGERTDLRYTTTYEAVDGGTLLRCEQAYRAKRTSFESTAAVGALHQRAVAVVAERLAAARRVVTGG